MTNELLLILSVFFIFGMNVLFFRFFGSKGLYLWTVIATITANIEVLILVEAFGMEQTLGNILFASTFLCTDIASEIYGKKVANDIVNVGIITGCVFMLMTQVWFLYTPSSNDISFEHMAKIFGNTPRLIITGLLVYGICQKFDVWIYEKWWKLTKRYFGNKKKYLWIRNNGSTLISQLLNTVLFTLGAFYGIYDRSSLLMIMQSSYLIFVVLSLCDTFFVYLARYWYERRNCFLKKK